MSNQLKIIESDDDIDKKEIYFMVLKQTKEKKNTMNSILHQQSNLKLYMKNKLQKKIKNVSIIKFLNLQ